jgi:hypothetical protein
MMSLSLEASFTRLTRRQIFDTLFDALNCDEDLVANLIGPSAHWLNCGTRRWLFDRYLALKHPLIGWSTRTVTLISQPLAQPSFERVMDVTRSKFEVVVNDQGRVVGEALLKVNGLTFCQGSQARCGQVVVNTPPYVFGPSLTTVTPPCVLLRLLIQRAKDVNQPSLA